MFVCAIADAMHDRYRKRRDEELLHSGKPESASFDGRVMPAPIRLGRFIRPSLAPKRSSIGQWDDPPPLMTLQLGGAWCV